MAQPVSVVHILIGGEPSEYRLPQQADRSVTAVLARARIGKRVAAGVQGNGLAALYLFEKSEACGCNCPEESVHCQWPSNAGGVTCVYGPRAASLSPWLLKRKTQDVEYTIP